MCARHAVLLTHPSYSNRPFWSYRFTGTLPQFISFVCHRLQTLPSSVSCKSFVCHSYENTGGVGVFFPFWNSFRSALPWISSFLLPSYSASAFFVRFCIPDAVAGHPGCLHRDGFRSRVRRFSLRFSTDHGPQVADHALLGLALPRSPACPRASRGHESPITFISFVFMLLRTLLRHGRLTTLLESICCGLFPMQRRGVPLFSLLDRDSPRCRSSGPPFLTSLLHVPLLAREGRAGQR